MENLDENDFTDHFKGRLDIEAGMSLFYFTKGGFIQEAIHKMKYQNLPQVGEALGRLLGQKMNKHPIYGKCDLILGVPLHTSKKRKRGYNQSEYIARGVSSVLGIPTVEDAVIRSRNTPSQTRRSRLQRMKNMYGGFEVVRSEQLSGKHVLLVDDVLTSGATLDFCGNAILRSGDSRLSLATLAMGSVV